VLATETRIGLNYNLGIGTGSLANVTSGAYNQAFGLLAGANITSANGNLLWGYKTGTSLFDGNHNIFIGDQTGSSNTSGDYNVAIGYQSMFNNKSQHNVALGVYTLYNSTSGNYNFASLFKALYSNTSGIDNIAIGYQALQNNTSGRYNIAFGINTLSSNVAGTANIAMGNSALMSNVVSNNVAIGDSALLSNTTGNYNTAIGKSAQISNITGVDRIAIGRNAMFTDTDGDGNIALGANSMYSQTTATHNVAIGDNAFYFNQTGVSSVAIGDRPLYANTTGDRNIAIGDHTMIGNTTGIRNIAVGVQSLSSNVSGNYNVSIGYHALDSNTTGEYNVAFGLRALSFNKTGSYNVGAGYHAMYNATGNYNIGLGSETGLTVTSGSNNVAIGNLADVPSATTDNQLSIQNMIYGINNSGTGSTVSTGFIGLGVKTPLAKLHVVGGVVASSTVNTQTIHKGVWIDITSARSGFTAYSVSPSLNSANANSYFSALYPYGDSSINNDRTMKFFSLRTGYNLEVQPFYVNKYGKGYFADTVDVGRLVIQNTATAVTGDSVLFKDPTTKVIKAATLGSMFSLSAGILNAGDYGSAYTQLVNNTNATAAYSETVYKDVGQQTLSSTITWVGTTAPSGTINHFYHWSQDGKKVTVDVNLNYTVGGTLLTEVDIDFPADLPVPETKTGLTAANSIILRGAGGLNTSKTTVSGGASAAYIAANSGATGYVIKIIQGSAASAIAAYATFTYFTP